MSAPTESFAESLMKGMYDYELQAVNEYLERVLGIEDCFDLIADGDAPDCGAIYPRVDDRIRLYKGWHRLLCVWREALEDLRSVTASWDRPSSAELEMFVSCCEGEKYDHAAWYVAQHALAELTGSPIIRRREG